MWMTGAPSFSVTASPSTADRPMTRTPAAWSRVSNMDVFEQNRAKGKNLERPAAADVKISDDMRPRHRHGSLPGTGLDSIRLLHPEHPKNGRPDNLRFRPSRFL